ncbi:MAG: hypothetical protein RLZZ76_580 [Candidatus Parcubacteria bacterium]|jgi:hypothetical protein
MKNGIDLGNLERYLKRGLIGKEESPEDLIDLLERQGIKP